MKFTEFTKTLSPLEIAALVIFIVYIIFPFRTPEMIAGIINTPLGLISIFIVTIYLFFYTHPIIGVIYIFVAYELLRRSSIVSGTNVLIQYTPNEETRRKEMVAMNPPVSLTLEEDIIAKMAPVKQNFINDGKNNDFKPVAERIIGASLL